jgi:hypothetical protein
VKYFDEEKMAGIQKAFDSEVLKWKGVVSRPMMGCQCYFRGRKFICFLVTDGIVLTKLSDNDQDTVKTKFGGKPFEMAGQKKGRLWVTPLKTTEDLKQVMPFVKKRYEEIALTKPRTR